MTVPADSGSRCLVLLRSRRGNRVSVRDRRNDGRCKASRGVFRVRIDASRRIPVRRCTQANCLDERVAVESVFGVVVVQVLAPGMLEVDGRKRGGAMSNEGQVGFVEGNCGDRTERTGAWGWGCGWPVLKQARGGKYGPLVTFRHQAQGDVYNMFSFLSLPPWFYSLLVFFFSQSRLHRLF